MSNQERRIFYEFDDDAEDANGFDGLADDGLRGGTASGSGCGEGGCEQSRESYRGGAGFGD
jgi:hypothetical protein